MLETIIIIAIGLLSLALITTIIWLLKVSGLFTSIKFSITQPTFEFLTVMYKFQKGDYAQSAEIFKDFLNYAPSHATTAIYYDNPAVVSTAVHWTDREDFCQLDTGGRTTIYGRNDCR